MLLSEMLDRVISLLLLILVLLFLARLAMQWQMTRTVHRLAKYQIDQIMREAPEL